MKRFYTYTPVAAFLGLTVAVSSCGRDRNNPGIQYAPEMYSSIPYEPFTQDADGSNTIPYDSLNPGAIGNAALPPEGTVARGHSAAFAFPNSEADSIRHSAALKGLVNPVPRTQANLDEGKVLYLRFCGACHGEKGAGNGKVAEHDAINPGAYNAGAIAGYTPGELYYVIMHGKGVMGSYASQLEEADRWKVVHYLAELQGQELALEVPEFDPSTISVEDLKVGTSYRLDHIYFNTGSADMTPESRAQMQDLLGFLQENPGLKVKFEGHTDNVGDAASNAGLSASRAASVGQFLVAQGIPDSKIAVEGFGALRPVAPNTSEGNRAKNRRVEINILEKN